MIKLQGLTWNHPRGYAGLEIATTEFERLRPGIQIRWSKHSLQDFESRPLEEAAGTYDLIILDHPFMGDAWHTNSLVNLHTYARELDLANLSQDIAGVGLPLYTYEDGLWALPIDAACQVAVYRQDLLDATGRSVGEDTPRNLDEVRTLARGGGYRLAIAFSGVHGLMTFFTLCANLGYPPFQNPEVEIVPDDVGRDVLELLSELYTLCPLEAVDWSSIAALDAMSERDDLIYCPYIYGYSAYSHAEFASHTLRKPLTFCNIPGAAGDSCRGSTVGGTGLAISRHCQNVDAAVVFASYVIEPETQKRMALALGQPGRLSVWQDAEVNAQFRDFYRNTLATISQAYVRPRYPGYAHDQHQGGQIVERFLRGEFGAAETLSRLRTLFRK
ncbi:MAG: extracellular solute-binding protein [Chloroflexi bacterium]|nr:extracellular solute-binding protein [Chloroflexota bacterium]